VKGKKRIQQNNDTQLKVHTLAEEEKQARGQAAFIYQAGAQQQAWLVLALGGGSGAQSVVPGEIDCAAVYRKSASA